MQSKREIEIRTVTGGLPNEKRRIYFLKRVCWKSHILVRVFSLMKECLWPQDLAFQTLSNHFFKARGNISAHLHFIVPRELCSLSFQTNSLYSCITSFTYTKQAHTERGWGWGGLDRLQPEIKKKIVDKKISNVLHDLPISRRYTEIG